VEGGGREGGRGGNSGGEDGGGAFHFQNGYATAVLLLKPPHGGFRIENGPHRWEH
jgi:hypothetical protein